MKLWNTKKEYAVIKSIYRYHLICNILLKSKLFFININYFPYFLIKGFELIASGAEPNGTQPVPEASTTTKTAPTALAFPLPSTTLTAPTPNRGHSNKCGSHKWNNKGSCPNIRTSPGIAGSSSMPHRQ
jgi:hypothetical protein